MGHSQSQELTGSLEDRAQKLENDLGDLRRRITKLEEQLRLVRALQKSIQEPSPAKSDATTADGGQPGAGVKTRRMSHREIIEMIANVLTEAGEPLKLDEIFRRVKAKSLADGTEMPGQGARGNIAVHLSPAAYPNAIYPVKRMRRGVYGLEDRDEDPA